MRKTGFAREMQDVEAELFHAKCNLNATQQTGRKARHAKHALRKAIVRFGLAELAALKLPKDVRHYARSNNRRHPFARPEVNEWHRASEQLEGERERYAEKLAEYENRYQTREELRRQIADLKSQIEELKPFVALEAKHKAEELEKKRAREANRKPKTLEDNWHKVGEDEYVPQKPIKAWARGFKGIVKVESYRENGSYILRHPHGLLRLKVQTAATCQDLMHAIVDCAAVAA